MLPLCHRLSERRERAGPGLRYPHRIYDHPGIADAVDMLDIDMSMLPRFTGQAEVVGLAPFEVMPEPSAFLLATPGILSLICHGRRRNTLRGFAASDVPRT